MDTSERGKFVFTRVLLEFLLELFELLDGILFGSRDVGL